MDIYRIKMQGRQWAFASDNSNSVIVSTFTKGEAFAVAAKFMKGTPGRLVIHDRDGEIQAERIYGLTDTHREALPMLAAERPQRVSGDATREEQHSRTGFITSQS